MQRPHNNSKSAAKLKATKQSKENLNGTPCQSIYEEVTLDIPGVTELMKACHALDVDLVQTAILIGEDINAKDARGNSAREYLFAGFNFYLIRFWGMHPQSDFIRLNRMSDTDRDEYQSLTTRLESITELLKEKNKSVS
jgi:hypothetical protein